MSANIKCNIISLNVRGLNNFNKRQAVFTWLEKKRVDIALLQETYSAMSSEHTWKGEWKGPMFFSHGTTKSRGTLLLVRKDLDFQVKSAIADDDGRYIILKCLIDNDPLSIVNIYAPNSEIDQIKFFQNLDKTFIECNLSNECNVIIGGDWNVIQDAVLDKSGGKKNIKTKSVDIIDQLKTKYDLCDPWRIKNPDKKRYTWRQSKPLVQCRLDYWLVTESMYDSISHTDIIPAIRSDHSAITLKLEDMSKEKGPSLWKFNSALLTDESYTNQMKDKLIKWINEYDFMDKRTKWEIIKYEIRKFSIAYSKKKKKETNLEKQKLEKNLIRLEQNLNEGQNLNDYNQTKQTLVEMENDEIKGMIIRSKVKWYEEGEKSTKYFLGLERRNAIRKNMKKLELCDGTILRNQRDIIERQMEYYKMLYTAKPSNEEDVCEHLFDNIKTLNDDDKMKCEGLLTLQECEHALKTFHKGKTPGNDGITAEFYQHFWTEIKHTFVECLNYAFTQDELTTSQRQAVICLVHKKDKDRLKLGNWRPISLLNVDYKIATKAITKRLDNIIPKLVDINQTGFIKGRYLGDAVRTLYDIIDYCKSNNTNGILMMVDFEKAFDSLDWDFMIKALDKMNFGPSLIRWIKLFYTNIESCILNNGSTSSYFPVKRGVRQGDPLSAYLFILSVEVLAMSVLKNESIQGITINDTEMKLIQYADDTTAILKDSASAANFLSHISKFKNICGLKINETKTETLWLGDGLPCNLPKHMKWTTKPVKVLGMYLSYDMDEAYRLNISEKMTNIKRLLNSWKQRKLTLIGKVLILKSLALSQIIHLANLQPFPDESIKELETLFYEFLWNGKTHKIKKSVIIQKYDLGGQSMIDLKSVILVQKLKWIKLFLNNHNCMWRKTMENLIKVKNLNLFLRGNFELIKIPKTTQFYMEVLQSLETLNLRSKTPAISKQFVFYNRQFNLNKKMVYDEDLFVAGIWRVKDLFNSHGRIFEFSELKLRGVTDKSYLTWRGIIQKVKANNSFESEQEEIHRNSLIFELKNGEKFDLLESDSKEMYQKIIFENNVENKAMLKYTAMYDIQPESWKMIYTKFRLCTKDNNIKELQYKILHRYIPTNKLLFQMSKTPSDKCTFCEMYIETIEHIFFHCQFVRNIWFRVEHRIYEVENITIGLTVSDVLLHYDMYNKNVLNVKNININTVLLYVKNYIWQSKLASVIPTNEGLIKNLENYTKCVPYLRNIVM